MLVESDEGHMTFMNSQVSVGQRQKVQAELCLTEKALGFLWTQGSWRS